MQNNIAASPEKDRAECRSLTMSEIASLFGISFYQLLTYEKMGLMKPVVHDDIRSYGPRDVERLRAIQVGRKLGYSLSEIDRLLRLVQRKDTKALA